MDEYFSPEQVDAYLEDLIKDYGFPLANWARKRVGNADDANDLVQDTFLRTYHYLRMHPVPFANPLGWLYRVIENAHTDYCRRQKRCVMDSLEALQTASDEEYSPSHQEILMDTKSQPELTVERKMLLEQVVAHIRSLPSGGMRDALALCLQGIDSPQEISELTGQTYSTARSNMSRGKKLLRTRLIAWTTGGQES